ncbi:MAG: lytic murein transglycosylase [Rhodospirillales bacterium]|nr:lytic murein transglycosylase [Rhodospirillales bacterium]
MHGFRKTSLALIFALVTSISVSPAFAEQKTFDMWLNDFKTEAVSKGIDPAVVNSALSNLTPNPKVINLDDPQVQPETSKKVTFADYTRTRVSQARIDNGRKMLRQHYPELKRIGDQYGVQPHYIVALWGMETNYGSYTGDFDIIRSLATLSWHHQNNLSNPAKSSRAQRRYDLFNSELINALKIIQQGHFTRDNMKGSWAGAFGQVQFMPSSFLSLAADGNSDGRKDIRSDLSDAFASAANYLSRRGWKGDQRLAREVKVPAGFSSSLIGSKAQARTLAEWKQLGVTQPNGAPIPVVPGMKANLVAPDGPGGIVFLTYDNFKTVKKWNNSDKFALSVGLLAEAIGTAKPTL